MRSRHVQEDHSSVIPLAGWRTIFWRPVGSFDIELNSYCVLLNWVYYLRTQKTCFQIPQFNKYRLLLRSTSVSLQVECSSFSSWVIPDGFSLVNISPKLACQDICRLINFVLAFVSFNEDTRDFTVIPLYC